MVNSVKKITKYGTEINLKIDKNNILVSFLPYTKHFISLPVFLQKHGMTKHEKMVLISVLHEMGYMLSYNPCLTKT